MKEQVPVGRQTSKFTRIGAMAALLVAAVLDGVGLWIGLSDGVYGWAFEMPTIVRVGLVGLTAGVGGIILSILRLLHQKGRDAPIWIVLVGNLIATLGAALLILFSMAASASI